MTVAHLAALGFALICLAIALIKRRPVTELVGTAVMCIAMADGMVTELPGLLPLAWSGVLVGIGIVSALVSRLTRRGAEALGGRLSLILCAVLVLAVDDHSSSVAHHGGVSLAVIVVLVVAGQVVVSWSEIARSLRRQRWRSRGVVAAPLAMVGSAVAMGWAALG